MSVSIVHRQLDILAVERGATRRGYMQFAADLEARIYEALFSGSRIAAADRSSKSGVQSGLFEC
jgi:hypothetical protein